ncbi:SigE family RNA polymerase sigma factor [Asanoa sp. WMMD1127]|uniref:SigE family RNA polymerase sigma factor n=1 Tax=Asanoa sp. WMMD1127 TaxID=3016107 RepID=UPI002415F9C1|nr:SigE family RNA polymerase sigma factor [Asanoa sp. WMMD1127]MDG4825431.1 SigE family RNA polymerase sigma factor [Asanoa sp. WMMD1127]
MSPADEDGFREFVASHMPALRKLAYVTCGDWHAAEDAVANALAKLYPRWGRLDRPDLYARTMVVRAAIDETRRPWWRRERSAGDALPDVPHSDPTGASEEGLRVRSALRRVPVRQRAVLVLRYYLDLTAEEAAEVLGVRPPTVRSQTSRGLANLRAALAAGGVVLDDSAEPGAWIDASQGRGGSGGRRSAAAALRR